jgi:uncharacterized OB-fold protein
MSRPNTEQLPAPPNDGLAGEYFAWHRERELRVQRCADCRTWIHPPQFSCRTCGGHALVWEPTRGRGTVFSWSVTNRSFHPAFADEIPYICAIVTLDEGPRVLSMLRDIAADDVTSGLPVAVDFESRQGGAAVAIFVPAPAGNEVEA